MLAGNEIVAMAADSGGRWNTIRPTITRCNGCATPFPKTK